jgi:hypothetical protein
MYATYTQPAALRQARTDLNFHHRTQHLRNLGVGITLKLNISITFTVICTLDQTNYGHIMASRPNLWYTGTEKTRCFIFNQLLVADATTTYFYLAA